VRRDKRWWYDKYVDKLRWSAEGGTGGFTAHLSDERDPAAAIATTARLLDPCVVCMATHGRSRSAAVVGSTFAAVVARDDAPLVAVGPRVTGDVQRAAAGHLAVCLDGSEVAENALPLAAAWAKRTGWRVTVLTAADPVIVAPHRSSDPDEYLREIAARPVLAGLSVETRILWGFAYPHVLVGEYLDTEPTDLLVATTHARARFSRAALGSEVARIVHRSPVPVLVQPAPHG
jgi:nucleotide-binding universal stress UspA family protein